MDIFNNFDVFIKINLILTALTMPLVIRYLRMYYRIGQLTPWGFIKIFGGSFVPFLNIGFLRMYLEPDDRTFQVCAAVLKTCNELDKWLIEQDNAGLLTMAAISENDAIHFPMDKQRIYNLHHYKIQKEFWKYMYIYLLNLGYTDTSLTVNDIVSYIEIHVRSKS